jgi:predicted HNH restriction endonuclease
MKITSIVSFVLVSVFLLGCSKKGPECDSLRLTINPAIDKLQKENAKDTKELDAASESALAKSKIYNDTATTLAKLTLTVPELKKFSSDYQTLAKENATTFQKGGKALKNLKATIALSDIAQKNFKASMDGMKKGCAEPEDEEDEDQDECLSIIEKLNSFKDFSNAKHLQKAESEMAQLKIANETLRSHLKELVLSLNNLAKANIEAQASKAKLEAMSKSLKAASAKHSDLVDSVNKVCAE